jgi:site-specific DNA recombinase
MAAKRARREGRIRSRHQSHRSLTSQRATLWPLTAIGFCLAIFGIVFSTLSTQAEAQPAASILVSVPAVMCGRRPRRRRREREEDSRRRKIAASYSRFSSEELQDHKSIDDQQRPCRERAPRDGNQLPKELEFSDEGVSGAKLRRDGFDRMLGAAKEGLFGTLYVFDLSRLARESIINASTLKKLVYKYKIRVVSVTEGIDSNTEGWFTLATVLGLQHEQYLKTLGANVLRGLIGNLLDGLSVGDLAYGYSSVPIPGSENRRRGRNQRPPKKYVIKEREAKWVRQIFQWFVKDRQPVQWIVRELNRLKVPRDNRSRGKKWGRAAVINILRRTKYIGIWPWGEYRNQRDSDTGEIYQEPRDEDEWKKWVRHLPELKIVEEEIFAEAQRLLNENDERWAAVNRGEEGQFAGSTRDPANPRHLLQRRIQCSECGSFLYVTGAHGRYLACPGARDGICSSRMVLPRKLAEKLILSEIERRIFEDPAWRKAVHDEALKAWKKFQSEVPSELQAAEDQLREVEQNIESMLNNFEKCYAPPEVKARLALRHDEKERLERQIGELQGRAKVEPHVLTSEQMDEALTNLHGVLSNGTPAAAIALGNLIGDVVVHQVSRPGRKRLFFQGDFVLRARRVVNAINGTNGSEPLNDSAEQKDVGARISIDFVAPDRKYEQSDLVKELSDKGLGNWEIADQLDLDRSRVTLLFKFWFERRGLPVPDRGDRPKRKPRVTPLYQRIADEAKRLWEQGSSEREIGRRFETTDKTVRNAIAWWHRARKLPVPKWADRRQGQMDQAAAMYQSGRTLREISQKLKRSIPAIIKLVDDWYASKGEVRPDGRSRRRPA